MSAVPWRSWNPQWPATTPRNAMTVDVEDYFQVQALADRVPRTSWDEIPSRVERNIDRLLQLFSEHRVNATFFTLGWIAERHPEMMRRIATEGHELASHGYDHTRVDHLTAASFREDVRRTKGTIEEITGSSVRGYRAPTFSIARHGRTRSWSKRDTRIAQASTPSATTFTGLWVRRGIRSDRALGCSGNSHSPRVASSGKIFPVRAADISASSPTGPHDETCVASMRRNSRVSFICIRGRSTPDSHECQNSKFGAGRVITPI